MTIAHVATLSFPKNAHPERAPHCDTETYKGAVVDQENDQQADRDEKASHAHLFRHRQVAKALIKGALDHSRNLQATEEHHS